MIIYLVLFVLIQIPVYLICDNVMGIDKHNLIKWNWSIILLSLIIMQIGIMCFNIKHGKVHKIFKNRLLFVIMMTVVFCICCGILWMAYMCFYHPENIKFG